MDSLTEFVVEFGAKADMCTGMGVGCCCNRAESDGWLDWVGMRSETADMGGASDYEE